MIKTVLAAVFFAIYSFAAAGQSVNKPKIDSLFDEAAAYNRAMGSIAISQNGNLVYQKAVGYRSLAGANHSAANLKTRYRIGSISKMFTAVMVFQLIEEGKLSLDTKLSAYYPSIPNAEKITVSQMLNHRSGLYNFVQDTTYQRTMTQPHTQAEILAAFAGHPSDFEPDSKAEYSNTNYVLLGYIIEQVTKRSYAEVLKSKITGKVMLPDTYYGAQISPAKNEAYSYQFEDNWQPLPETDMSLPGGAGAVVSTPADLVKFINALFAGKLINTEHLNLMKTMTDGLGMGMFQISLGKKRAFGHNGDIDGFSSVVGYIPEDKLAYAYCGNGIDYPVKDLVKGALNIYFGLPYQIPIFKTPVLSTADLNKYIGNYSSLRIPIKISITKKGNTLIAQASGQPAFVLKALDTDKFGYALAGIILEFRPLFGEFTLKQGTGIFPFTKDED